MGIPVETDYLQMLTFVKPVLKKGVRTYTIGWGFEYFRENFSTILQFNKILSKRMNPPPSKDGLVIKCTHTAEAIDVFI